jgi:methylmalonyl-CoA mutase C-terminal domain/subunit
LAADSLASSCARTYSYQTPEKIVRAAVQEDVDVVGLSCHRGGHLTYVPQVIWLLREENLNVPVVVGGILPREDIPRGKEAEVAEVFVGTLAAPAVEFIRSLCQAGDTR